jgi:hypothetical protein
MTNIDIESMHVHCLTPLSLPLHLSENVFGVAELEAGTRAAAPSAARPRSSARFQPLLAKALINLALLWVTQHLGGHRMRGEGGTSEQHLTLLYCSLDAPQQINQRCEKPQQTR